MVLNYFCTSNHQFCILNTLGVRRRKTSIDKKHNEAIPNKRRARISLSSSFSSEIPDRTNTIEKSSQPSVLYQTEKSNNEKKEDVQQPVKKKRGRKPKAVLQANNAVRYPLRQKVLKLDISFD